MDLVKKAIKCVNCLEILDSPVILPCSHSICNKHVSDDSKESIKCRECGMEHEIPEKNGFLKNQALEEIINSKIGSLDLGKEHVNAKEHCDKLERLLKRVDLLESDPSSYVREEINELRNRVHLKSEQLKLTIEKKSEKILKLLKEYEDKSFNLLPSFTKIPSYNHFTLGKIHGIHNFDELRERAQSDLESWRNVLNEMKIDENKWSNIVYKSNQIMDELTIAMKPYKTDLILKEEGFYKAKVNNFENLKIQLNIDEISEFDKYNNYYSKSDDDY